MRLGLDERIAPPRRETGLRQQGWVLLARAWKGAFVGFGRIGLLKTLNELLQSVEY